MADIGSELEKLPLRAVVAFAARCARRARPLYEVPGDAAHVAQQEAVLDGAIQVAEEIAAHQSGIEDASKAAAYADAASAAAVFAADSITSNPDYVFKSVQPPAAVLAAHAASYAAGAAARVAASEARDTAYEYANAAVENAGSAIGDSMGDAANADLDRLLALKLGSAGQLGVPVDPSESGPLGPLWPDGAPEWYTKAVAEAVTPELPCGDSELVVELEVPEGISEAVLKRLVADLALRSDDYHRALGGKGLKVDNLEVEVEAGVPEGVPRG